MKKQFKLKFTLRGQEKTKNIACGVCANSLKEDTKGTRFDFLCKGCEDMELYSYQPLESSVDNLNWVI